MACEVLAPQPGIDPGPSMMRTWNPDHWTMMDFPLIFNTIILLFYMCNYPHISPCFKILPSLKILNTHLLSTSAHLNLNPGIYSFTFCLELCILWAFYINGIIQYVVSRTYILSLSIIHFPKVEKNVYKYLISFI